MSDITDDEYAILMIAAEGQRLAPIGRWAKPVNALHERGLLIRQNEFNFVLSDTGKQALEAHQEEIDNAFRAAFAKRVDAKNVEYQESKKDDE